LYALGHGSPEIPGYGLGIYPYIKERLYSPDMRALVAGEPHTADPVALARERGGNDPLSRLQFLDTIDYLPNDILTKVDRTSMAHALEVRAPLLDYELVEFAASLPASFKFRGGVSKYLFRRMCRRYLPESVFTKRKQGFAIPKRIWFRADLETHARERLLDPRTLARGYFDRRALEAILRYHRLGRRDYSEWIWCLLILEEWHRVFCDPDARRV